MAHLLFTSPPGLRPELYVGHPLPFQPGPGRDAESKWAYTALPKPFSKESRHRRVRKGASCLLSSLLVFLLAFDAKSPFLIIIVNMIG